MVERRFFKPVERLVNPLRHRLRGAPRTAFIFSGGGSLGAVQIGMLRALVEAGINADLVVGCSVGAINGAAFAAEPSVRGVARLERIWRRLAADDPALMPNPRLPVAVQLARKGESLHDPATLETLLTDELPAATFEDLRIPFHCVATDLDRAREHWFTEGPLVPALMASASLPAVYPAHSHGGRTFIDGGVLNEVHTERALELGATELYVLHVGHLDDRQTDVQRPFDSALRAYWTARRWRLEENLRQIPPGCVLHRLPSGSTPRLRFDDFSQGPDLAEIAYEQTAEYLATGILPTEQPVSMTASEQEAIAQDAEPPPAAPTGESETDDDAIASTP
ncbi:MAG: patatin-like phospholipase family protein [Acidimicrobiales bacterium]